MSQLPDLPTLAEAGKLSGFEFSTWVGLFAPAETPLEVIGKIHADSVALLDTAELRVRERFTGLAFEIVASTPGELRTVIPDRNAEIRRIGEAIRRAGRLSGGLNAIASSTVGVV